MKTAAAKLMDLVPRLCLDRAINGLVDLSAANLDIGQFRSDQHVQLEWLDYQPVAICQWALVKQPPLCIAAPERRFGYGSAAAVERSRGLGVEFCGNSLGIDPGSIVGIGFTTDGRLERARLAACRGACPVASRQRLDRDDFLCRSMQPLT